MRARPALLALPALLLPLLAGCVEDAPPTGTGTSAPPDPDLPAPPEAELAFGPVVELGTAPGEPNVAVAPDGTVYVVSITTLWRSSDGGATFEEVTDGLHGGGDGDLAVDGEGRLHYLGLGGRDGPIPYQRSEDRGARFSAPEDISGGEGADREWIHATPEGRLYAVWRDADGLVVNVSPDAGRTWEGKVTVAADAVAGPIVADPADPMRVSFPFLTFGGAVAALGGGMPTDEAQLRYAASTDGGRNWTVSDVAGARGSLGDVFATSIFPVAAIDAAGTHYLVVSAKANEATAQVPKPASQYMVVLLVSHDGGATWSEPQQVSASGKVGILPWVVAGTAGRVAVTWLQNTLGGPHDTVPDQWHVMIAESLDAGAATPSWTVAQVTDAPAHIGSVCTGGTTCLAGDRSLLDFFEVALQPNGQPVVAWTADATPVGTTPVQNPLVFARAATAGPSLL